MRSETRRAAWIEIDLDALKSNFQKIKSLSEGAEIIAAIKADAYGHGAVKSAWELIKEGIDYLAVATLSEAVEIRTAGIRKPIVLLSPTPRKNIKDIIDLDIIPVISSYEDALMLSEMSAMLPVRNDREIFIAVDTGMGRIGFLYNDKSIAEINSISALPKIKVKGIFSHLASSGEENDVYTLNQLNKFIAFRDEFTQNENIPSYATIANSAAIVNYPQAIYDAVRPGIMLYGLYPSDSLKTKIQLSPVMSVKANIAFIKNLPQGCSISYNSTFTTSRDSLIATIPLGYADGLSRIISNKGYMIVNGEYAPIVGNICMDQTMIDVTDIPNVKEYDEVVIMGSQGGKTIFADDIAAIAGTINYEIVTGFGLRLPKIYISNYQG